MFVSAHMMVPTTRSCISEMGMSFSNSMFGEESPVPMRLAQQSCLANDIDSSDLDFLQSSPSEKVDECPVH
jgi:hypothetical protein